MALTRFNNLFLEFIFYFLDWPGLIRPNRDLGYGPD